MIKPKLLFAAFAVCFTFTLVILTAFRISQPQVLQNQDSIQIDNRKSFVKFREASQSSQKPPFDYQLPFPGILPNHPFYWAKMIRDKVKLNLTKDKIDLFYLYLQYADKRLISGIILAQNNQKDLAVTTLTKAEKYLFKAGNYLVDNFDKNNNSHLYHHLAKTHLKHEKELRANFKNFSDKQKEILEGTLENNQAFFNAHLSEYFEILKPSSNEASPSSLISE